MQKLVIFSKSVVDQYGSKTLLQVHYLCLATVLNFNVWLTSTSNYLVCISLWWKIFLIS